MKSCMKLRFNCKHRHSLKLKGTFAHVNEAQRLAIQEDYRARPGLFLLLSSVYVWLLLKVTSQSKWLLDLQPSLLCSP